MSTTPYERIVLTWAAFKVLLDKKNPHHQHIESAIDYSIWFDEAPTRYYCAINFTNAAADKTDYDDNYKSNANWAVPSRAYAFATGDFKFRGDGNADAPLTIPKGTSGNIDFNVTETVYLDGGEAITENAAFGDYMKIRVVDVDGLYSPAGTVLDEYAPSWGVHYQQNLTQIKTPYAGKVYGGLVIRVIYTSTGTVYDPKVIMNLLLHKAI